MNVPSTIVRWVRRVVLILVLAPVAGMSAQVPTGVRVALQTWTGRASDPCEGGWEAGSPEEPVFTAAAAAVAAKLNDGTGSESPQSRVRAVLLGVEAASAELNAGWPEENRFHFSIVPLAPALLVVMRFRTQARFLMFTDVCGSWSEIGSYDRTILHPAPRTLLRVHVLRRGPAGAPRFLVEANEFGCAGSISVVYQVLSWARHSSSLSTELAQEGAFGLDEAADGGSPSRKDPFHPVGELRTAGRRIVLPYCQFSALDWWDNPSLCAADEYDVAGDTVVFRARRYNRPELVPIARAYEFTRAHELPALEGYFSSQGLARRFLRYPPVLDFASDPQVRWLAGNRARIAFEDSEWFDVQRNRGRWVIVGFGAL